MLNIIPASETEDKVKLSFLQWLAAGDEARRDGYVQYRKWYDGDHYIKLTDRIRAFLGVDDDEDFRLNFVPVPVDILNERLSVAGFDAAEEMASGSGQNGSRPSRQALGGKEGVLWDWWVRNRMDVQQGDVHLAALRDGDAFMLTEWDNDRNIPRFTMELAYDGSGTDASNSGVDVVYDDERPGVVKYALKYWRVENDVDAGSARRINVYLPDQVRKYISKTGVKEGDWLPYEVEGEEWPLPWLDAAGDPLGVPVTHFKADAGGYDFGRSEEHDIIPIQRALNKSVIDLLGVTDATSFQILYVIGAREEDEITVAPGSLLQIPSKDAKMGHIPPADPSNVIKVVDHHVIKMAQRSRTPLAYFQITGQVASAETQKADDTGLVSKAEKRAGEFGNAWEDVMHMAVKQANAFGRGYSLDEDRLIEVVWDSFERVDKHKTLEAESRIVLNLVQAGATLEGAAAVVEWPEEMVEKLLRGDMVDGIAQ